MKSETLTIKMAPQLKRRLLATAVRRSLDLSTLARMLLAQGVEACERSDKKRKKIK